MAGPAVTLFPEYTDHGIQHVEDVVATGYFLANDESRSLMTPWDAGAFICASLLHDLAMHLGRDGFVRLVCGKTPHDAVPWFAERHGDATWPDTWLAFSHEVSRFGAQRNSELFGDPEPVSLPHLDVGDLSGTDWTRKQNMMVGEFIRKDHGRLAHEIALCGLPTTTGELNIVTDATRDFADLTGLIARSHSMPLRDAVDCLSDSADYFGNPRVVRGVHVPFIAALLRIGDFLQVESHRASMQLMNLRPALRSPVSRREWRIHQSVAEVHMSGPDNEAVVINSRPPDVKSFLA